MKSEIKRGEHHGRRFDLGLEILLAERPGVAQPVRVIAAYAGCTEQHILNVIDRALAKLRLMKDSAELRNLGRGSTCFAVKTPRTE